jgi:hypothetical protein
VISHHFVCVRAPFVIANSNLHAGSNGGSVTNLPQRVFPVRILFSLPTSSSASSLLLSLKSHSFYSTWSVDAIERHAETTGGLDSDALPSLPLLLLLVVAGAARARSA